MKEVKIFSLTNQTLVRPMRHTKRKDYTRMHKIILNWLEKNIAENARQGNVLTNELEKTYEYFLAAHGMEKWNKEREDEDEYRKTAGERHIQTAQEYYKNKFAGLSSEAAKRAAEQWSKHEEAFMTMRAEINEEDEDISPDMYHDILVLENNLPF